ncbi:hypothetical protein CKN94_16365 [Carnobacterium maltaromaticum]|nr:hypothetical protein CKN94_16365 [Carnobacterium maltaromaticum]TFJ75686.1 hypothetical protein CKN97_16355 [Carnobacterium maltaromaticum]
MLGFGFYLKDMEVALKNICSFVSANIYLLTFLIMIVNCILISLINKRVNSEKIILYCMLVVNTNGLFLMFAFILMNQNIYLDSLWFYLNLLSIGCVVKLVLRRNEELKKSTKNEMGNWK